MLYADGVGEFCFLIIGGDSGLSDGIYFNMYNGSGYGDRVIIKPSGRVNIIQGSRTLP